MNIAGVLPASAANGRESAPQKKYLPPMVDVDARIAELEEELAILDCQGTKSGIASTGYGRETRKDPSRKPEKKFRLERDSNP